MTDELYDMTTIEGCIGWGLFRNPPERRRLEAELARLRAMEAAVARHVESAARDDYVTMVGPASDHCGPAWEALAEEDRAYYRQAVADDFWRE